MSTPQPRFPSRTPSKGQPPLVLIVDDDADIRDICDRILTMAGYRTAQAASGDEALTQLQTVRPNLILLDLMMPGLDGFTTAHQIHSQRATAGIPIVILTAAPASREEAAYRVGAQAFCTKPLDAKRLTAVVRSLCPIR